MKGYIYKISNNVNNNVYIGKTSVTIEDRWKEHCRDMKKEASKNRPLYRAMQKYGIENFSIDIIEECDYEDLSNAEIKWINFYDSYNNGYNATLGGDGRTIYDYDEIAQLIKEGKRTVEICSIIGCYEDVVRFVAKKYGLKIVAKNLLIENSKSVNQYDKQMNYIQTFDSCRKAGKWVIENGYSKGGESGTGQHIGQVCSGERKTAYGFIWRYV